MKTIVSMLSVCALLVGLVGASSAVEDKKDSKSPLPGNATWELKPLTSLFRVIATDYDADGQKVKWTVETRNGHRTADFVRDLTRRPFTFHFLDEKDNELAIIQLTKSDFQGLPGERIMRERTRLTIMLSLPRAMPRTKKVVLQRGVE